MTEIDWAGLLVEEDVKGLLNGLFQLACRHPAVRPLHFVTDGAAVSSQTEINADLTQELFLELFQKQRFEHYIKNKYTSLDIENELARIEVPNLVGARLRKRYPESFRLARRVSSLLKTSTRFRRFGADASDDNKPPRRGRPSKKTKSEMACLQADDESYVAAKNKVPAPRRQRMVSQGFGLQEGPRSKRRRDSCHFTELIKSVPMRKRDTRGVGRSGSSQLILSNPDLQVLVVEVFKAIDSPADVRTIRQLVLSKIPLQDYNVASLDEQLNPGNDGSALRREVRD